MIVASLLLILVAVALLVMGLTDGSSSFLISSIVASLLAAVALVIGARQAATARRAAEEFTSDDSDVPFPRAASSDFPDGSRADVAPGGDSAYSDPGFDGAVSGDPGYSEYGPAETDYPDSAFAEEAAFAARSDDTVHAERVPEERIPPSRSGADRSGPDRSGPDRFGPDRSGPDRFGPDLDLDDPAPVRRAGSLLDGAEQQPAREPEPDYSRASWTINAARSGTPDVDAWRRAPGDLPADVPGADRPAAAGPAPAGTGSAGTGSAGTGSAGTGPVDDFGEPDADDPDDEPLPQSVSPSAAVGVARLDAEVLVVDGRPRYHMADCSHLVGRVTEPIPVNEAVELGFSPCGRCRPVDRLVAAAR